MIRPKEIDIRSLELSPEEGFLLSRIDGPISLRDLVALCGLDEPRVRDVVRTLLKRGAVEVEDEPWLTLTSPTQRSRAFSVIDELDELEGIEGPDGAGGDSLEVEESGDLAAAVATPTAAASVARKAAAAAPLGIAVCGLTDRGLVRSNNEDAFAVLDVTTGTILDVTTQQIFESGSRGTLLIVSDGMGGENAGEIASGLVIKDTTEHLAAAADADPDPDPDPDEALRLAIEHANANVHAAAKVPAQSGMGATVVAALLEGGSAHFADVGDSRAYVLRQGVLSRITKEQTQIQLLIDRGLLTPEAAKTSVAKNVVLQAMGMAEVIVAQRRVALRDGDRLLLCSDGLADVTDEEIAHVLRETVRLDEVCARLVAMTKERGGHDNVTLIVAHVAGGSLPRAAQHEGVAETLTVIREFSFGE